MARKTIPNSIIIHESTPIDPDKLNPAPYNPRKIKPAMLQALKASIRSKGFIDPLVVQKRGMVIIGGHQRLKAMRELCAESSQPMPRLPCIVLDISDREAKKLNVTLNRVGGEFDSGMLSELLRSLEDDVKLSSDELLGMGINSDEFDGLIKLDEPENGHDEDISTFAQTVTLSLSFTDTKMRDRVKRRLEERAKIEGKKSGEVVESLLRVR